jgi:hypothetical protein
MATTIVEVNGNVGFFKAEFLNPVPTRADKFYSFFVLADNGFALGMNSPINSSSYDGGGESGINLDIGIANIKAGSQRDVSFKVLGYSKY